MPRPGQAPGPTGVNQLGGLFVNGCPLPAGQRKRIVQLASWGLRATDISWHLKVSIGCVSKVLCQYHQTGSVQPGGPGGRRPQKCTPEVVARIAQMKQAQPSLFAWEIRRQLQTEGICAPDNIPSVSSIHRIQRKFQMSVKPPEQWVPLTQCLETGGRIIKSSMGAPQAPPAHPLGMPNVVRLPRAAGNPQRGRMVFSTWQLAVLEQAFQNGQYLEAATRDKVASATGLPGPTIRVWFSNRRARGRREAQAQLETRSSGSLWVWGSPPLRTLPQPPPCLGPSAASLPLPVLPLAWTHNGPSPSSSAQAHKPFAPFAPLGLADKPLLLLPSSEGPLLI